MRNDLDGHGAVEDQPAAITTSETAGSDLSTHRLEDRLRSLRRSRRRVITEQLARLDRHRR